MGSFAEETLNLHALVTEWQERANRFAEQAAKLDAEDKPLDALRLGTYALQWRLAAKELEDALKIEEHMQQVEREIFKLRAVK